MGILSFRPQSRWVASSNVAATGDFKARTHAVALEARNDGHIAVEHGLQAAPHLALMKIAQGSLVKTKAGVLGNIATGTKMPFLAAYQHAAQLCVLLYGLEN